jgi:hypothetical protein
MNAKLKNAPRAFWRVPWKLKLWYSVGTLVTVSALTSLMHAQTLAGAAWYGGMTLMCASATLGGPRHLNKTIPQIYQVSRARGLMTQTQLILGTVGLGLVLLSVYFWLSSG